MKKETPSCNGTDRQSRPPKARAGRMMLYILLGLAVCILVFFTLLYPIVIVGASREANIKIPKGATEQTVRDSLTKYLGADYANTVIRLSQLRKTDFSTRHGAYTIEKGEKAITAMRRLTSGAQTPVRISINGFRSLPKLVERISRKMEFPPDSLQKILDDPQFMAQYGLTPESAMALFIDDTYEVYWSTPPADVVKKIGENYRRLWNSGNTELAHDLGRTPSDIMIVASIVDEETNDNQEKGTIGRLYLNRLQNNMKLQADPTVRFAIGDFTIQRVTKSDLAFESPYNTYLHTGLPPGPIRTTSAKTVRAVLRSKPNNYLYMCAKEDFSGSHNFSASYDEHLLNASRYRSELDRQGITR